MKSNDIEVKDSAPRKPAKPPFGEIFLRSFFIQTLMNYPRMQGLGFGMSLSPLARGMGLKGKSAVDFLRRHLDFFNAHPYMASYALGATARLELEGAAGERVKEFKGRLFGPLGLFGDQIFWARFKPLCAGLAVLALLQMEHPGYYENAGISVLILTGLLLIYNSVHFTVRWRGLTIGYESGDKILRRVTRSRMVRYRLHLGLLGGLVAGLVAAKTAANGGNFKVYFWSFLATIVALKLKSPLWLTITVALSASIAVWFFAGIRLTG